MDAVIVHGSETRRADRSEAIDLTGKSITVVQAKARRLNMPLMGQTYAPLAQASDVPHLGKHARDQHHLPAANRGANLRARRDPERPAIETPRCRTSLTASRLNSGLKRRRVAISYLPSHVTTYMKCLWNRVQLCPRD